MLTVVTFTQIITRQLVHRIEAKIRVAYFQREREREREIERKKERISDWIDQKERRIF